MFKVTKCTRTAAAVIAVASVPSAAHATAYARWADVPPSLAPSQHAARVVTRTTTLPHASSAQGFHLDDAGIGATGMLALFGAAGASSVLVRRRRDHPTPTR